MIAVSNKVRFILNLVFRIKFCHKDTTNLLSCYNNTYRMSIFVSKNYEFLRYEKDIDMFAVVF